MQIGILFQRRILLPSRNLFLHIRYGLGERLFLDHDANRLPGRRPLGPSSGLCVVISQGTRGFLPHSALLRSEGAAGAGGRGCSGLWTEACSCQTDPRGLQGCQQRAPQTGLSGREPRAAEGRKDTGCSVTLTDIQLVGRRHASVEVIPQLPHPTALLSGAGAGTHIGVAVLRVNHSTCRVCGA